MDNISYFTNQPVEVWKKSGIHHQETYPLPALQSVVHVYWQMCVTKTHHELNFPVIPITSLQLLFWYTEGTIEIQIIGVHTLSWTHLLAPKDQYFGVQFYPGQAFSLLGIPLNQFQNGSCFLEDLSIDWGPLKESMMASQTFAERVQSFEIWFLQQLTKLHSIPPHLSQLLLLMCKYPHYDSIDVLAKQIGLSTRQLNRLFNKYVGISPKSFNRILRFHRAYQALKTRRPQDYTSFSLDLGYYDQSHFINDFRTVIGISPTQWIRESHFSENV